MKDLISSSLILVLGLIALTALLPPPAAAQDFDRPHIYGVGIMWADWLSTGMIPPRYREDRREYNRAQLDKIREAGGTATHGSFDWVDIEKVRGTYDWSQADERIDDITERGLAIYAYIGNTPDWARANPSLPGHRTPPAEEYAEDFERFCTAVAERYKGRVDRFFFWNEPNGCSWVNEGCGNSDGFPLYTKWLKRAFTALKKGNPDCLVGAGVLDYNEGVKRGYEYIEGMYREGARDFFDAIVIHPYNKNRDVHWEAIHDTRRVMVENGDAAKAIWINEYGWPSSRDQAAARYLKEFLTEIRKPQYNYVTYCRFLVLTDLPDGTYGMCDRSLAPRPVYLAFAELDKGRPVGRTVATRPAADVIDLLGLDHGEDAEVLWRGATIFRHTDPATGQPDHRVMFPRNAAKSDAVEVLLLGPVGALTNFSTLDLAWTTPDDTPLSLAIESWNGPHSDRYTVEVSSPGSAEKTARVDLAPGSLKAADGEVEPVKDAPAGLRIRFTGYVEGMRLTGLSLTPVPGETAQ